MREVSSLLYVEQGRNESVDERKSVTDAVVTEHSNRRLFPAVVATVVIIGTADFLVNIEPAPLGSICWKRLVVEV